MNKTLKGIIGGGVLLGVLGGVLAFLKLTDKKPEQDSSSSAAAEEIWLWHAHSDDISQITVEPAEGEKYVANRKIDRTETTDVYGSTAVQDIANYYLEGYEDLPMSTVTIRTLATRSPELAAVSIVLEHAEDSDMSRFGLDHATRVTYVVDGQDEPIIFLIGDKTQVDSCYYLRMEGGDTVYTVSESAMEPFLKDVKSYLGTTVIADLADDDDTIVESVRISRKNLDYDIAIEYDETISETDRSGGMAMHTMVEPFYCMLSPDKSTDATHGLFGLTAAEVLTPHPTQAEIDACGFDDPFVTVTMVTDDGKQTVFRLADTYESEDGNQYYYGMVEGINCIYGFSEDASIYDNVVPGDISSKNIINLYVWDVARTRLSANGKTLDFKGSGTDQSDFVLTLNGEPYEDNERYRQLYAFLLGTKAEDLIVEEIQPEGEVLAEILLEQLDGTHSYDIKFYPAGTQKAYVSVNGEIRYRCRKSYVETLIHNIEIFSDPNEAIKTTW
ncbi:MAG: DUF4340 domain-containing protein [Oscillospiraceae bacterium]|nr:DUF4340 domain-containing protein [Oscillospiraceae bacterium]